MVLFLSSILFTTFIFILLHCVISLHSEQIVNQSLSLLFSGVFSMVSVAVKERNSIAFDFVFFSEVNNEVIMEYSICLASLEHLLRGKEINRSNFLFSFQFYGVSCQVLFVDIFQYFGPSVIKHKQCLETWSCICGYCAYGLLLYLHSL